MIYGNALLLLPLGQPEGVTMSDTCEMIGVFITWTTYGTWLPGDARGWRAKIGGNQLPDAELESVCRAKLKFTPVLLRADDRVSVEEACRKHCEHRGWQLHAVNARSNHVHVVVSANERPQTVRDQLKANCTRHLRCQRIPLVCERTWTKGGDCSVLFDDDELESAIRYTIESQ